MWGWEDLEIIIAFNNMKRKLFFMMCGGLFCMGTAVAQNAVVPAGGTASGNGGSVTYTVGQIAVQTNSDGTVSISEGVQQPYEISVVGVDDYPGITLNAVLFPNPTQGNVQLTIVNLQFEGEVKVFDSNGKFLLSKKIEGENTALDLSPYAPATYYVNVYSGKKMLKSFKVVKMAQ